MLMTGELVGGRYKVLGEIGRGGMSVVYLAVNERANKMWAVKEVRPKAADNFEAVAQRLREETDLLKSLRQIHLPTVVDVIEEDDQFLVVMDYIEGNTLKDIIEESGPAQEEKVIEWAIQLCDVLGYLHTRVPPVIYRDMKPGNIILKPDGCLVLVDFGTARVFKESRPDDTICLGTVGFAAPEQFPGGGQTDERTDIFGLGTTMYYLAAGREPVISAGGVKPIRQIRPELSRGFEAVVMKCMRADPEARYQSSAELTYALEHYEEEDVSYRARQWRRIKTFFCVSALSLLFALSGAAAGTNASARAADTYESRMERAEKTLDYGARADLYRKCIDIPDKADDKSAYLGLMRTFRDNDHSVSPSEAIELENLITEHSEELRSDPNAYSQLCFEMGKLFWYYYDYEDGKNRPETGAMSSVSWFEEALRYASDDADIRGMSEVYAGTGRFYRDIEANITEAEDRGTYRPFFRDLKKLMTAAGKDESQSSVVRLRLSELIENSLWKYAAGFKYDGVGREELEKLMADAVKIAASVPIAADITRNISSRILANEKRARQAIADVYSVREG